MLVDPKGFEPSFPCLQGKSLPVRQKGPYGTDREIRTLTVQGLSLLPLPIGVRQHDGALHGDRTHYLLIDNQVCNPLHFQSKLPALTLLAEGHTTGFHLTCKRGQE